MKFTATDHKFAKALHVDLGEPAPLATDDELADAILAKDHLFDEEKPTLQDWQDHATQMEKESLAYHRNWQEAERKLTRSDNRNKSLRAALFLSLMLSSALAIEIAVKLYRN